MKSKRQLPTFGQLLFPSRCIICRNVIGLSDFICPECARKLPYVTVQTPVHGDCFDACYAPFYYEEPLRTSFLRYKFNDFRHYAQHYGAWMADHLLRESAADFDLVTWCPISVLRRMKRSYDQSELLAQVIADRLSLPLKSTLRKAHRKPLSRSGGDKATRAAILLGAYSVKPEVSIQGKRILLVDDIVTTGSTLSECARMLKTAGASEVTCITLARKRSSGQGNAEE